ncbi:HNH endonuclease [Actinoplanes sp. Pm04-4]|uniref:HNH endonuclease n=1 Tax=Paractinoplanes pyxinae TaxID=2997416 RepID=A0ABT4BC55_9ACTN|nr:HNH endonuclease [Actinoplanes pyxinae]MCY1144061.1 HNH endonuclease [Actinoplanes pyxinae]
MRALENVLEDGKVHDYAAQAVARNSRGRPIPADVKRLPSGKLPSNRQFAGKKFDDPKRWTPKLQEKYPDGVRFSDDGFPDFSPHVTHTVKFDPPGFAGNHSTDFTEANRLAGLPETPDGYTGHHHQDTNTMQLIPSDLHNAVRHAAGVAFTKGRS